MSTSRRQFLQECGASWRHPGGSVRDGARDVCRSPEIPSFNLARCPSGRSRTAGIRLSCWHNRCVAYGLPLRTLVLPTRNDPDMGWSGARSWG